MLRQFDETSFVSGQIRPEDVPALATSGITLIVNNRPDGEQPGQPAAAEIEAAAEAARLHYLHLPVTQLSPEQVETMAEALASARGPVLAFCASGTRSTYLWALAQSSRGEDGDTLAAKAAAAGYDLTPIRRFLG